MKGVFQIIILAGFVVAGTGCAQMLLYQWNFDNAIIQLEFLTHSDVQSPTSLSHWNNAFITDLPTMPFAWTDGDTTNISARFHPILVGPMPS